MELQQAYGHDRVRISLLIPELVLGDPIANAECIVNLWHQAEAGGASLVVTPELSLSGYTLRDLFQQRDILRSVEGAAGGLIQLSATMSSTLVVGAPVEIRNMLFNAALVIHGGELKGLLFKNHLPNYGEFEEDRWFLSGKDFERSWVDYAGTKALAGGDPIFTIPASNTHEHDFYFGVEVCEDGWVERPRHNLLLEKGAHLICNLSASNYTVDKASTRRAIFASPAIRGPAYLAYTAAGPNESSTDMAFDGDAFVVGPSGMIAESQRFYRGNQILFADLDTGSLPNLRLRQARLRSSAVKSETIVLSRRKLNFSDGPPLARATSIPSPLPFVPNDNVHRNKLAWEVFEIQAQSLVRRMNAIGKPKLVLGISGGIDSTHAALVCAEALRISNRQTDDLLSVSMPGFGTSARTREQAERLARALGSRYREIDIAQLAWGHLIDLEHPVTQNDDTEFVHQNWHEAFEANPQHIDVTVENVQARIRTLTLMNLANQEGGFVVGTGDLSEKALGWSTYSGDQIAHYDVNCSVPKTLIQHVMKVAIETRAHRWSEDPKGLRRVLHGVLETPISPELLPTLGQGMQLTEDTIGPYVLHDFFIHHFLVQRRNLAGVFYNALAAFEGRFTPIMIWKTLRVFMQRFTQQQFKRSATPDGPKVTQASLSPRGDWRMPSDLSASIWDSLLNSLRPIV